MKKNILLCFLLVSYVITINGQNFAWAKRFGLPAYNTNFASRGLSVATDNNGNVISSGMFSGTVDLDPGSGTYTVSSAGQDDIYISKLDASGNFVWGKTIGSSINEYNAFVGIDSQGNVYVAGYFALTVDFDPGSGVFNMTAPYANTFVLKLDAAGNFLWAKNFGGGASDATMALAFTVDAGGNAYTTGWFTGIEDFDAGTGTFTMSATGPYDAFTCKMDASGNFVWATQIAGPKDEAGHAIAVDASGNVYTTGIFQDTPDFDSGSSTFTLACSSSYDQSFALKLNSSGNFVWAVQLDGGITANNEGNCITVDNSGSVYFGGYFVNIADFDPGAGTFTLVTKDNITSDGYLVKLNSAGNFIWAKGYHGTFGNNNNISCNSVNVDANGNIFCGVNFSQGIDADPGPGVTSFTSVSSSTDMLFSFLNATGNLIWTGTIGANGNDFIGSTATDAAGNYYSAGTFASMTDFDPAAGTFFMTANGNYDAYVMKFNNTTLGIPLNLSGKDELVFPNPVMDKIHISLPWSNVAISEVFVLKIYDEIGQEVFSEQIKTGADHFDVSSLAPGFYVCHVFENSSSGKPILTQKIIKQ